MMSTFPKEKKRRPGRADKPIPEQNPDAPEDFAHAIT